MATKIKIIAHCMVRNEERFVWYSLNSVLPYVDHIMVWVQQSEDRTWEIVNLIQSPKIDLKQVEKVTPESFSRMRQAMLDATPRDFTWVMILDGDEIWPQSAIATITGFARQHPDQESLVARTDNLVGDIYHKLPESAGQYNLAGQTGHLNLRFMNRKKIPGLHVEKPHGQQGFFDDQGLSIQNRSPEKITLVDVHYSHATHLQRSVSQEADKSVIKRAQKYKFELGNSLSRQDVPEVFFAPHPGIVPTVTNPAPVSFWLKALVYTPARRLKRLLVPPTHGY